MNNKRYALMLGFLILLILTIEVGIASYNPLFPVYSLTELKNSTEISIKYQEEINHEDFNIVLEAVAQKIRTFDNNKYEKIKTTLSLVGGELRDEVWVDRFSFELEGYRDNKTESWQMEIEHPKNEKNATITRVLGGGTLVPDKYADIARSISLKNLDKEILNRTPEIAGISWIIDKPALVVFTFKDPDSPDRTIVAVDLNKNTIHSVEKKYWQTSFPIYFSITSNPSGADVYLAYSPELCGPRPYTLGGHLIGKTPLTYKYEYNETFFPFSGLFSLFSFRSKGYEDSFKCININGGEGRELSVDIISEGGFAPVSRTPLTYEISAELKLFDINYTTDMNITKIGHFGLSTTNAVEVSGNYAYTSDGNDFVVLDISNKTAPAEVGRVEASFSIWNIALSGNYAYVVTSYNNGLMIFDVSNPAAPSLKGSYNTSGNSFGVAVVGKYAYVADDYNGLVIVDVSDPAASTLKGSYDTQYSHGVAVAGNYAYVADYNFGLVIVDVSDPATPTLKGSYDTAGNSHGVAVAGNYAYVADGHNGLVIVNVSDPAVPTLKGSYDTAGYSKGLAVAGNYAYVADDYNGLVIVNVSDPGAPTLKGSYDTAGYSKGLAVAGNYAYVTNYDNGLEIFRIDTAVPTEIPKVNPTEKADGFTVLILISMLLLVFKIRRKKSK